MATQYEKLMKEYAAMEKKLSAAEVDPKLLKQVEKAAKATGSDAKQAKAEAKADPD